MLEIAKFSSSSELCSICIGLERNNYIHCGILYSVFSNGIKNSYLLHLGNAFALVNEPENITSQSKGYLDSKSQYKWNPFVNIPNVVKQLILSKCITIAEKNPVLKYGIFYDSATTFDSLGNLILGANADGLTCATFVKTVLSSAGFKLVIDESWPDDRETDLVFLNKLIDDYESSLVKLKKDRDLLKQLIHKDNGENIVQLKKNRDLCIKNIQIAIELLDRLKVVENPYFQRFRPEEIAGAAFCDYKMLPLKFRYVPPTKKGGEIIGEEILAVLKS